MPADGFAIAEPLAVGGIALVQVAVVQAAVVQAAVGQASNMSLETSLLHSLKCNWLIHSNKTFYFLRYAKLSIERVSFLCLYFFFVIVELSVAIIGQVKAALLFRVSR